MNFDSANHTEMFYQQQSICFECTQCGHCCTGKGSYVFVNKSEVEEIRKSLNITRSLFKKQYLDKHPEGDRVLSQHDNGDCVFLDNKNGCRIYKSRPAQCSTYPFWPEILESNETWLQEADRCEGIDRGKEVSVQQINGALRLLSGE